MNLAEIRKQDIHDSVLSDCVSPGFMGMTRMVILRDLIIKTEREILDIQDQEAQMDESDEDAVPNKPKTFDDSAWIETLSRAPDTNFFLFVGNKSPVTDLEKWLVRHATIHEFPLPSASEVHASIVKAL